MPGIAFEPGGAGRTSGEIIGAETANMLLLGALVVIARCGFAENVQLAATSAPIPRPAALPIRFAPIRVLLSRVASAAARLASAAPEIPPRYAMPMRRGSTSTA